jgi:RimJ/RimL family protein N-acetyltransferase
VTDLPLTPLTGDLVVLELLDPDEIADMLADPPRRRDEWHPEFPREDDRDGVRMAGEVTGWGSRRIVRRADGLVVGSVGFFGPPSRPTTACRRWRSATAWSPAARRQGLMRDALTVLLRLTDAAGVRVRGATTRDNEASLASMRGAGFVVRDLLESPADPEREVHLVREPSP